MNDRDPRTGGGRDGEPAQEWPPTRPVGQGPEAPAQPQPSAGGYGYPPRQYYQRLPVPFQGHQVPPPVQAQQVQVPVQWGQGGEVPAAGPQEPDWNAMADQHESRLRNRRRLKVGLAAVGVLALAGGAWWGVSAATRGKDTTVAQPSASASSSTPSPVTTGRLPDAVGDAPLATGAAAPMGPLLRRPGVLPARTADALTLSSADNSFATSSGPVVDVTNSFTVTAWVLNRAKVSGRIAVSQGSQDAYAFALGRDFWTGHNQWVFKVQTAAGGKNNTVAAVYSKADVTENTWVFLAATYDVKMHTIALYVDGVLQGSKKVPSVWSAPGSLQLGRLGYQGRWADPWNGQVTRIETWSKALLATQLVQVMGAMSTVAPDHAWLMK